ncbi:MAG: cyclic pyranopterin monophosphate synthase MoaC [Pseudomonadota bacterium]
MQPLFSHFDKQGKVTMVDVSEKPVSTREAIAVGAVLMQHDTLEIIKTDRAAKGNVLETARIAGIMAAKKTSELIPLCHPVAITHLDIDFILDQTASAINIQATAKSTGQTGVEMEALVAVTVSALTIYDMCKSYDKQMTLHDIMLVKKSGGRSGDFVRKKN